MTLDKSPELASDLHRQPYVFSTTAKTSSVRVVPHPEESLNSLLTRFVGATGHKRLSVLQRFFDSKSMSGSLSEAKLPELAELLGIAPEEIRRRQATPKLSDAANVSFVEVGGESVRRAHIVRTRRAVSPAGLRKDGVHRHVWDVVPFGFCPESLEILITHCPNEICGKALGWGGNSVCHCNHCGYDLRNAKTKRLKAGNKNNLPPYAKLFYLDPKTRASARNALPDHLKALPSCDIIFLALCLGLITKDISIQERMKQRIKAAKPEIGFLEIDALGNGLCALGYFEEYSEDIAREIIQLRLPQVQDRRYLSVLGPLEDLTSSERSGSDIAQFMTYWIRRYFSRNHGELRMLPLSTLLRWSDAVVSRTDAIEEFHLTFDEARRLTSSPYVRVGATEDDAYVVFERIRLNEVLAESRRFVSVQDIAFAEQVPAELIEYIMDRRSATRIDDRFVFMFRGSAYLSEEWDQFKSEIESNVLGNAIGRKHSHVHAVAFSAGATIAAWICLFEKICDGNLKLASVNSAEQGIKLRWMVDRREAYRLLGIARELGYSGNKIVIPADSTLRPLTEACKELGITSAKASELAALGYLKAKKSVGTFTKYYVEADDIARFKADHIAVPELCARFRLGRNAIPRWLKDQGVQPLAGQRSPIFFRVSDVEAVVAKGVEELGHLSPNVAAGAVATIQFLKLPTRWTADELRRKAGEVLQPDRKVRLMVLANLLDGQNVEEAIKEFGVTEHNVRVEWIPIFRNEGLGVKTTRRVGGGYLTTRQRLEFESQAREVMESSRLPKNAITSYLINLLKETCGVSYHPSAVRRLLHCANIQYPKYKTAAQAFTAEQKAALHTHILKCIERIHDGDLSLSTETIRYWARDQFGILVTRNTISRFVTMQGLAMPSIAERSAISKRNRVSNRRASTN